MMKKYLLFVICLCSLGQGIAQQKSNIRLGVSSQFSYLQLTETFAWTPEVEGYQPGIFAQLGLQADFQVSEKWSIRTGMQYSQYRYKESSNFSIINFDIDFGFNPPGRPSILPDVSSFSPIREGYRNIRTIGIPILIQYHLEDLVPNRIRLSVAAGFIGNINANAFSDGGDSFKSSLSTFFLDGQIGPEVSFLTRKGQWSFAPVFRMALLDYANFSDSTPFETSQLKPYSLGVQLGYSWNL